MKKILQREHISWKCLLNHCLFNGSTPLHRKTPSDRDVLFNLYHSTAQPWSYKCLLGTPSSHNNHYSRQQDLNTALVVPGRHWQGGWADTSAAFVIHKWHCGKPTKSSSWAINRIIWDHWQPLTQHCQGHYYTMSPGATSTCLLNTSKDSDSTTALGRLFQCLGTHSM